MEIVPSGDVPVPDTDDLRVGVPIHDALLALLPLVGTWHGTGAGLDPSAVGGQREFRFGQQLEFTHDGRPFLAYTARAWLLDDEGALLRLAWRESGFWRPGPGPDDVEVALACDTGRTLVLAGVAGDQRWELAAERERRMYAVRGDELLYATERAAEPGRPLVAHLNARLTRAVTATACHHQK